MTALNPKSMALNDRLIAEMASRIAGGIMPGFDLGDEGRKLIAAEAVALAIAICEEIESK